MKKRIETFYQRLILEDIDRPRYVAFKRFFPWFIVGFLVLMAYYYYLFFRGRVTRMFRLLEFFHSTYNLQVWPRSVVNVYDEFLLFVFYIFFILLFLILAFIAFDSSQRSQVIRTLRENEIDNKNVDAEKK